MKWCKCWMVYDRVCPGDVTDQLQNRKVWGTPKYDMEPKLAKSTQQNILHSKTFFQKARWPQMFRMAPQRSRLPITHDHPMIGPA